MLTGGTRLGPYEILSPLGAGGMGEVYRATDTRLDRVVALKVLSLEGSGRADLRQRFDREARVVSSLSHPHICALYDIGQQEGVDFLVMEYLEGETLVARLAKGALPIDQVLRYAIEIADALEQAHRHGVTHRDLKPGNIMLTKSGTKLLDFGLAKLRASRSEAVLTGHSALPTKADGLTAEGTILGTLQYMAPEQLEGKEADARTDLFAFGVVIYEMATGRKAFAGKSQASLIVAILSSEPPSMVSLQPLAPPTLDQVVKTCLTKDPDERWQTAHDLKLQLMWISEAGSQAGSGTAVLKGRKGRERFGWIVAVVLLIVALALAIPYFHRAPANARAIRFSISPPEKVPSAPSPPFTTPVTISPDGTRLAFVGTSDGRTRLWVRPLDALSAQPLAGTEGASSPFWSPDSRSIGFFAEHQLKKIPVFGGPPQTICKVSSFSSMGTWGREGAILFWDASGNFSGIHRVPATGGAAIPVTMPDISRGEQHFWPHFLPDGHHFLYVVSGKDWSLHLYAGSLDSKETKPVAQVASRIEYALPGYLLYVREGSLLAQPFDAKSLRFTGEPFPIVERVQYFKATGDAVFSVSESGMLAYQAGVNPRRLLWMNRAGQEIGSVGTPGNYSDLRLSPEGQRAAVAVADPRTGAPDLWIYDLTRDITARFTFDPASEFWPVWSPDGRRMVFATDRDAPPYLLEKALSDTGSGETLLPPSPGEIQIPEDWSRDGRYLLYNYQGADTNSGVDLWILPMIEERKPVPFVRSQFNEKDAKFSPDSRWVAYVSDESGRPEVYVQPFQVPGERRRISATGGSQPRWRRDGKELFYLVADNKLMSVAVKGGKTFESGVPRVLFKTESAVYSYDVASDGQRFLINTDVPGAAPTPITVVVNWTVDLHH